MINKSWIALLCLVISLSFVIAVPTSIYTTGNISVSVGNGVQVTIGNPPSFNVTDNSQTQQQTSTPAAASGGGGGGGGGGSTQLSTPITSEAPTNQGTNNLVNNPPLSNNTPTETGTVTGIGSVIKGFGDFAQTGPGIASIAFIALVILAVAITLVRRKSKVKPVEPAKPVEKTASK